MKNLVVALLLLAAVVSGIGIYRGWFTVNHQKLEADEQAVKEGLQDLEQKAKDKAAEWNKPAAKP